MAKSPEEGMASLFKNLEAKTGKTIADWVSISRGAGLGKHKEIVSFIKTTHGLTHGYANQLAQLALASNDAPVALSDELVTLQYAGAKASVRPIYDAIVNAVKGFGSDVELAPKKAYVSLRRSKQFGLIQPSTASRIDLGLMLKGVEPSGRLEASGSFSAMCSHRVRINAIAEVDSELIVWLRAAYDEA